MTHSREDWARGYGPVQHSQQTQEDVARPVEHLGPSPGDGSPPFDVLHAADRLASCAGMWLVAHMTYANAAPLDGRDLEQHEFREKPEGHTGGSLNMVPAYVGCLAANAQSAGRQHETSPCRPVQRDNRSRQSLEPARFSVWGRQPAHYR